MLSYNATINLDAEEVLESIFGHDSRSFIQFVKDKEVSYEEWDTVYELYWYFKDQMDSYRKEVLEHGSESEIKALEGLDAKGKYFIEDQIFDNEVFQK